MQDCQNGRRSNHRYECTIYNNNGNNKQNMGKSNTESLLTMNATLLHIVDSLFISYFGDKFIYIEITMLLLCRINLLIIKNESIIYPGSVRVLVNRTHDS